MHRLARTIAAAAAAALLAAGCDGSDDRPATRPVGRPSNVLLITLDTTRADHLGCYGRARVKTPSLDRLAADGTLFETAFTPVPSTFPSHATLFTGLYPRSHGVHDNAVYSLGAEATTLAEILKARGHATGAFVSAFVLDAQFGLDQGFDVYDDEVDLPLTPGAEVDDEPDDGRRRWERTLATAYQRRGDATVERAERWLQRLGVRPFFLWVHLFDAHQPYQPPPPWDRAFDPDYRGEMDGDQRLFWARYLKGQARREDVEHMVARYDGEISWMDQQVERLLDSVRRAGRWDETLTVVVGDHGEGLGEHTQIFEHNGEIYDEVMRVPLIVRRPDPSARGERVTALVRTLDVAPTVLEWLALPPEPGMQGQSLLAFTAEEEEIRAAAEGPGEILLEALRDRQVNPVELSLLGLRGEGFKAILALDRAGEVKKVELFDLRQDPHENVDLAPEQPERAKTLRARILALEQSLPRPQQSNVRELGALESDALRALGYGR